MILLALALAAAQPAAAPATPPAAAPPPAADPVEPLSDQAGYRKCAAIARHDAEKGVAVANDWHLKGGGIFALQCLGLAYSGLGRWAPAATAFEQAAQAAENDQDPRRADFWVQAGNAWLAGGEPAKARKAFDAALATAALTPELRGEVLFDRARAGVALGDLAGARADIDKGLGLVPADPFGWYLSSALALRQHDLPRAQDDIARGLQLAPDDADLLLHAGNVAGASGEVEAAKGLYMKAIKAAPQSDAAKSARAALAANPD